MQHTSEGKISQNINSLAYLFKLSFQGTNQHTAFNTPAFQTLNMFFLGRYPVLNRSRSPAEVACTL